jgi:cell division protein FtsZ
VAEIARDMGILTVAVVTKPFPFEGPRRMKAADMGIAELSKHVDSLITIPNQKLLTSLGKNVSLLDAFKAANNVLLNAVQGIAELITRPGLINVDFADVRTVMSGMGVAMMGMGRAQGEDRAAKAAQAAISSPLLEDICLDGAKGILVNITAGLDMGIHEFEEVGEVVRQFASPDATVVVGTVIDPEMRDEIRVTLVATGLEEVGGVRVAPPALKAVEQPNTSRDQARARVGRLQPVQLEPMPPVSVGRGSRYENVLDVPPIYRQSASEGNLDIPAFLRKQAD